MSSGRRVPILIVALGIALAAGPARAEERPDSTPPASPETQASGQWTDPPSRNQPAPTHAAAPRPVPMPAKVDERVASTHPARRAAKASVARSATLKRKASRHATSRPWIERRARIASPVPPAVTMRASSRIAPPLRQARGPARGLRPVYGFIEPDAPAAAYYAQRRFGPERMTPSYRLVRMDAAGRPLMRWGGSIRPFDDPLDSFEDE